MYTRRFRSVLRSTPIVFCLCLGMAGSALAQAQAPDEPLSPEVLEQIAALQQAKASRTPAEQKISSRLLYAIKQQRGELPAGVSLRVPSLADTGGRIDVEIAARPSTNLHGLLASRNAAVMRVNTEPRSGVVYARASLDADGILALAARADVTAVHLPERVESVDVTRDVKRAASAIQAALGQGAFVTEGLLTHRFNVARAAFGLDGTGVKIGVLANGVDNLAASQAAGELGPVTILSGQAGLGDDGTAMLEIRTWLTTTALDIHAPGPDRNSGYGIVMPMPALVAAGATGGAVLDVSSYVLQEDPGNGDGQVIGGEGAKVRVSLANLGLAAASNITATLTATTPGVTITQPVARVFPNAAVSSTVSNTIPFTFTLATPQVLSFVVTTGACAACYA